jgi:hypothetical protein
VPRRGLRISERETGPPQGDSEAPGDRLPSRASKRGRGGPGKPGPRRRKGEPQRGNARRVRSGGTFACPVGRLPEGSNLRSRDRGQRTRAERQGRIAGGDVCGSAGAGPCRRKLRSVAGVRQTRRVFEETPRSARAASAGTAEERRRLVEGVETPWTGTGEGLATLVWRTAPRPWKPHALKSTETLRKAAREVARVLLARVRKGTGDARSEAWSEGPEGAASL